MFTSFKPDLEMKSIRSLISDVFIAGWFDAPVSNIARELLLSFLAAGFDDLDLLMIGRYSLTRSTYSPVDVCIFILSPVFTNRGTLISAPFSNFAGFNVRVA